jgi:hypothetical protein
METSQLIIGVIAAIGGGLGACFLSWKGWDRDRPWITATGLVLVAGGLFCGTVVAAGATKWSYLVGAVLAGLVLLSLPCRILWDRYRKQRRERALGMWLPEGTIEGEGFRQALAVCSRVDFIYIFLDRTPPLRGDRRYLHL